MRVRSLAVLLFALSASPALAGPILDRVKADGVLRCGGVDRPGLVEIEPDGKAKGLELDICRALASVVLGDKGRLEFTRYDSEKAFAAARGGHEDVMFLTGREMIENGLADKVIPGPSIFVETTSVMVQDDSPYKHLQDLAGKPICFALGPHAQYHLHDWFAARHLSFIPMGFQEDVEMNDAYTVRYCHGLAGETTTLAETSNLPDLVKAGHRFLPETLAAYPILATTAWSDGQWAAIVAWTVETLKRADAPTREWSRGGFESIPVEAPELGLAKDWQKKVVSLVGAYGEIFDRNLGAGSELKLDRGLNRSLLENGAFAPPYVD